MAAVSQVEKINKNNKVLSGEIEALQNSVSSLNWTLRVPLIGDAMGFGYRAVDGMKRYEEPLVKGSLCYRAGFKTVGEIITTPISEGGFNLNWDDWVECVTAFDYRRRFSIHHAKKEDILGEYQDIVEALGQEPADSIQYHRVKSELIKQSKTRQDQEHNDEVRLLKRNIFSLNEEVASLKSSESELKSQVEQYVHELEEARSAMHQMAVDYRQSVASAVTQAKMETASELKAEFESELNNYKSVISDLENRLGAALEELSNQEIGQKELIESYESQISELKAFHESNLASAMSSLKSYEDKINQYESEIDRLNKTISASRLEVDGLQLKVDELAARPLAGPEIMKQIEDLEVALELKQTQIGTLEATVASHEKTISEQEHVIGRMKEYVRAIKSKANSMIEQDRRRYAEQAKNMAKAISTSEANAQNILESYEESQVKLKSSIRQRGYLMVITSVSVILAIYALMA